MIRIWYSTEENADDYRDYVTLAPNVSADDIDDAITCVMRKLKTDNLWYAVVRGGKTSFGCVSICRPVESQSAAQ